MIQTMKKNIAESETTFDIAEECYFKRIQTLNPKLEAFVHVVNDDFNDENTKTEESTATAKTMLRSHRHRPARKDLRPLEGVSIGIKDIIDVQGMPTLAGCPQVEHLKGNATQDATVVSRLRHMGGCIILGKTTTTQYAHLDPSEALNPFDENHTPGGSSSGSAVAVASGMCPVAIGTQTGGSILRPSSYFGIVGFKPSLGSIDMSGILPVSSQMDCVVPMAKTVKQVEAVWKVMAGTEEKDDVEKMSKNEKKEQQITFEFYLLEPFMELCSDDVRHKTQQALDVIFSNKKLHKVSLLPFRLKEDILEHFMTLASYDAYHFHKERGTLSENNTIYLKPKFVELINQGKHTTREQYEFSQKQQLSIRQKVHEELFGMTKVPVSTSSNVNVASDHSIASSRNNNVIRICVLPTTPTTAPQRSENTTGDASFNVPWSFVGGPAITLPIGLSEKTKLPCGLQLVSGIGTDYHLVQAAKLCEQRLANGTKQPHVQ